MGVSDLEIAIGNTIPVSLIGVVIIPVFQARIQALRNDEQDQVAGLVAD